jgi:hypothetical protein
MENGGFCGIGVNPTNAELHVYRNATIGTWGSLTVNNATVKIVDSGNTMYLDGNAIISGGNFYLGTNAAAFLSFGTNDTEHFRLESTGDITNTSLSKVESASTTARSMANAVYTDFIFEIEDEDSLGEYNNATGVFTATYAGCYTVSWYVGSASAAWAAGEYWWTVLSKNNSTAEGSSWRGQVDRVDANITRSMYSCGSATINLAASDTLRIKVTHNQGAAVNSSGTEYTQFFHIARII